MVHHGFGGTEAGSDLGRAHKVAKEISNRPDTIFAHVVKGKNMQATQFNVIWEFDPERLPKEMKLEDLVEAINRIDGVHKDITTAWIIQQTYQNGEPVRKPRHIPGEPEKL